MAFLLRIEEMGYSTWIRESGSLWAFPMYLFAHTLGMSIVAGGAAIISMALLGLWPKTPLKPLARMYPVMMFKEQSLLGAGYGFMLWRHLYRKLLNNDVSYRIYCFANE